MYLNCSYVLCIPHSLSPSPSLSVCILVYKFRETVWSYLPNRHSVGTPAKPTHAWPVLVRASRSFMDLFRARLITQECIRARNRNTESLYKSVEDFPDSAVPGPRQPTPRNRNRIAAFLPNNDNCKIEPVAYKITFVAYRCSGRDLAIS